MKLILVFIFALLCVAAPLHAGQTGPDSAQSLYLQAGKEERAGSMAKAREIYESIIDRFPESDFAVKSNDRLLVLPDSGSKAVTAPPNELEKLFNPPPTKPLPADALLRRGVEAARDKSMAKTVQREEYERLKRSDEARDGHKIIQAKRSAKEAEWLHGAERKVIEQFGMNLEEMSSKLELICKEAGVKGECSEEAFYSLVATP